MILCNTGSINCTEVVLILNENYPTQPFTYEDVYHIEQMCIRFKQGILVACTKSFCKKHRKFSFVGLFKYVNGSCKSDTQLNDKEYSINFGRVNPVFNDILNFVSVGYARDDFLLLENMVEMFDEDTIRQAIKEQDDDWNYPKLLLKKATEIKLNADRLKRRADEMEKMMESQKIKTVKDVDVFGALDKMSEWDSVIEEEEKWSIFDK